ncbi:hypothetical protein PVAP13_6NG202500 [Panicum virgatum]|uniref:Uncharacterized protein n=1 Tax=Panicum virgatum TaxID=38727 RepID=A0A8T0R060_PANVG|nr:hypothetical protein PVAP13_6NG202500 [Panicum virgatum]
MPPSRYCNDHPSPPRPVAPSSRHASTTKPTEEPHCHSTESASHRPSFPSSIPVGLVGFTRRPWFLPLAPTNKADGLAPPPRKNPRRGRTPRRRSSPSSRRRRRPGSSRLAGPLRLALLPRAQPLAHLHLHREPHHHARERPLRGQRRGAVILAAPPQEAGQEEALDEALGKERVHDLLAAVVVPSSASSLSTGPAPPPPPSSPPRPSARARRAPRSPAAAELAWVLRSASGGRLLPASWGPALPPSPLSLPCTGGEARLGPCNAAPARTLPPLLPPSNPGSRIPVPPALRSLPLVSSSAPRPREGGAGAGPRPRHAARRRATLPRRSPRDPLRRRRQERVRRDVALAVAPHCAMKLRYLQLRPASGWGGGGCSSGGEAGRAGRAPIPAGKAGGGAQLRLANRAGATCCSGRRGERGRAAPPAGELQSWREREEQGRRREREEHRGWSAATTRTARTPASLFR